jgi:hypothetical protein
LTYVIEMGTPLMFFVPDRAAAVVAFVAQTFLQLVIAVTGNYGYFNWLTWTLCFSLLDIFSVRQPPPCTKQGSKTENHDGSTNLVLVRSCGGSFVIFGTVLSFGMTMQAPMFTHAGFKHACHLISGLLVTVGVLNYIWQSSATCVAAVQRSSSDKRPAVSTVIGWVSLTFTVVGMGLLVFGSLPGFLDGLAVAQESTPLPPFIVSFGKVLRDENAVSSYGLFRSMTGTKGREEIVIEGSVNGSSWIEIPFRFKTGALARTPPWVAPHQPRLDWQMWFADIVSTDYWLPVLCYRLTTGSSDVLSLLDHARFSTAFPIHPPTHIRILNYRYNYTHPGSMSRDWWTRKLEGPAGQAMTGAQWLEQGEAPPLYTASMERNVRRSNLCLLLLWIRSSMNGGGVVFIWSFLLVASAGRLLVIYRQRQVDRKDQAE